MTVASTQVNGLGALRHQVANQGTITMYLRPSGAALYPGSAVCHQVGSALAESPTSTTPKTNLVSVGTVILGVNAGPITPGASSDPTTGGALDVNGNLQYVSVAPFGRTGYFVSGTGADAITYSNLDQPCYWIDDNTLALTDGGGTRSFAGWVDDVPATGQWKGYVVLRTELDTRGLYELYSAGQAASGTQDDSAAYVMTNLPAGTFAAGVWTATATGALNTTQDGLTVAPAAGDKVIFPPGTITTLVVSAANSGPYECVTPGATGVKAVYARPARFAHSSIITPGTKWKVTLGGATTFSGTTWRCDPTTAIKVVGTDDPVMFPERVVVQKTCSSGTATIATVPLRAAGKFSVTCDYNGGTPAATTTTIQASTQTAGAIGTASIVIQEQSVLGTAPGTGSATCAVTITQ